jgi:hypothetical protein
MSPRSVEATNKRIEKEQKGGSVKNEIFRVYEVEGAALMQGIRRKWRRYHIFRGVSETRS